MRPQAPQSRKTAEFSIDLMANWSGRDRNSENLSECLRNIFLF